MVKIEKTGTDTDLTEFLCELAGYPPGTYQVTIYPVGDLRSSEQNRYLWGVVYPLLLEGLEDIGYAYTTTQEVHEFCKRTFSDRYVNYHSGEIIDIPDSTKEMDRKTFATYLQVIREWSLNYIGIEIPDPQYKNNERTDIMPQ